MTRPDQFAVQSVWQPGRGELLLELMSEEIPARMQRRAIEDLTGLIRDKLVAADLPPEYIQGYVTPRRLVIIAQGIPAAQPDRSEERRGPRLGAPPQAIEGFLRSAGLRSIDGCEIRDTDRGQFYFAVVRRAGRLAAEVLSEVIRAAIGELVWPKSMHWPGASLRWVRPLTSVVCLFDGEIVLLAPDWFGCGVPIGRMTRGHRFLSPGEICVRSASDYLEKLQHAHVMIDHELRREAIRAGLDGLAATLGVAVKPDPALIDEVAGLVEYPVVLAGAIDPDFMSLPPEVLATAMRAHQKYFSCVGPDGSAAPHFLFVANNLAEDGGKAIVAGNERVLRARLADARFFWDQDCKVRLEDRVAALKDRVFHALLGDLFFKAERMTALAGFLALLVDGREEARAKRAAWLAKADLSTGMVGEFPELQGIMGRHYALHDGEDVQVANAIAEHYKPLGPHDTCPMTPVSVIIALADKIDSLVGFLGINEKPSGSRDPFALRRAALGIIRLVLENRLRLPLAEAFRRSFEIWRDGLSPDALPRRFSGLGPFGMVDPTAEALEFIGDRLKVHLRGVGMRHDLIAAVFALAEDDLVRLIARANALAKFLGTEDGNNLLIAYRRASNIVTIEERKDRRRYHDPVDPTLFRQDEESALHHRLDGLTATLESFLAEQQFDQTMSRLATLRQPVDEFFDTVTVNTDEPKLRENRLRLLSRIRATMNRVADFSQIEG